MVRVRNKFLRLGLGLGLAYLGSARLFVNTARYPVVWGVSRIRFV